MEQAPPELQPDLFEGDLPQPPLPPVPGDANDRASREQKKRRRSFLFVIPIDNHPTRVRSPNTFKNGLARSIMMPHLAP